MGWDFLHKERGETATDILKADFTWTKPETGHYSKALDVAIVNFREAYLAVEYGDKNGPQEVYAVVCLLEYRPKDYFNFGYKAMDETGEPYYYNCPERILRLLTPNEKAKPWRDKCWARIQARKQRMPLRKGMIIRFTTPIIFRNGIKETTFRVEDPRRLVLRDKGGLYYKIRRSTLDQTFEVLTSFPEERKE